MNYANEGLERYIDGANFSVIDPNNSHALAYLDASDQDPNLSLGQDWLQVGFGVGSVDNAFTYNAEVYVEDHDVNSNPTPYAAFYPQFSLGNDFFTTYFTGQYSGLNGLYDGFISTPGSGSVFDRSGVF